MSNRGFIQYLRNRKAFRNFIIIIVFVVVSSTVSTLYSLTNGPTQPETSSFKPLSLQQNVDLFSGQFNYSIPLFSIGPYPFILSYNSNICMEEEASWVGLGWNLNTGSVTRNLRGFPDEFMKDTVIEKKNQKKNVNVCVSFNVFDPELFSIETPDLAKKILQNLLDSMSVSASGGVSFLYNNYSGVSFSKSGSIGLNLTTNTFHAIKSNIGFSTGDGGLTISPSVSFDKMRQDNYKNTLYGIGSMGFSFNSLKGIHQMNFGFIDNKIGLNCSNNELSITPSARFPYKNTSFSFNPKTGSTALFADLGVSIGITYGIQKQTVKQMLSEAYGFLNMYGKTGSQGELLDFTREKDNNYMPGNPYLPQTFLEPDIFSVNTFVFYDNYRAFMNSEPLVSSPAVINSSEQTNVDLGIEFGGGNASDFGGNLSLNSSYNSANVWTTDNSAYSTANSLSNTNSFALSTPFPNIYFKSLSSASRSPLNSFNQITQRFEINGNNFQYNLTSPSGIFGNKYNSISSLKEATVFQPITKSIHTRNNLYNKLYKKYESTSQKQHHISAYKVNDSGGNTLFFGCPAINYIQKEVSFSVEGPNNNNSLYIDYIPSDASTQNLKGLTNHFYSRILPAYAYAYLLTELYNSEYTDLTGDGPTPDDPGDYAVFSYSKKVDHYKWRTPYTKNQFLATYNPNLYSLYDETSDDIASYTYGEKDIWYVDTVWSKHEMAVFYTTPRKDSHEANSEHGGKGPRSMFKLDSINVYNIHNYYQSVSQNLVPQPDKKISFRYDYSQCKGVFNQVNNNEGKLTLTELIITDKNTNSGYRHSYRFGYGSSNPDYSPNYTDRWGNYDSTSPNGTNKFEFPYTTSADTLFPDAWRLNSIHLPSGGKIFIEYEANRYCYVQDRPAMQMFQIKGTSESPGSFTNKLHSGNLNNDNYIYFETDIPPGLTFSEASEEFEKYFDVSVRKNLYFNFCTNISPTGQHFDNVYGFADIEEAILVPMNNSYYGRIKVKGVPIGRNNNSGFVNPITKAAIHFGIINTPRITFGHPDLNNNLDDPIQFLNSFINNVFLNTSIINNLITTFQGVQKRLFYDGIGQDIIPEKCFIRLLSRNEKPGGGSRVKRITYDNSWGSMSQGEAGSSLSKEYLYLNEDGKGSGVATYEPQIGADEIPQHIPYTYKYHTNSHSLANWARNLVPHVDYMNLYPLCESAYPAPSVGYSRVVEFTKGQNNSSNGYTIINFYTSKDYPTKVNTTSLKEITPTLEINAIFYNIEKKHTVASQGFSVITNDMNGKEKSEEYYDANNRLLKRVINHYSVNGKAKFYNYGNSVSNGYSGLEKDAAADFREEASVTSGKDLMLNSNTTVVPIPLLLITVLGSNNFSEIFFRSATYTTVWYQKAFLSSQEVEDRGADLSTENIYLDPVTGNTISTSVKNSWNKKTYTSVLPAYYIYSQMGPASGCTGNNLSITTNSLGKITSPSPAFINEGDKLLLLNSSKFVWIYKSNGIKYLIGQDGQPAMLLSNEPAYLWESGKKNYLNLFAQSVTSKSLPSVQNSFPEMYSQSHGILSSEATVYNDYYSYRCGECGCINDIFSDSISVSITSKSPNQIYIPYTIKKPCNCNGIVTLFPPENSQLYFYWPQQNVWGVYVQGLCENQNLQLQVFTDTTSNPVGTFNFSITGSISSNFTLQQPLNPFLHKLKNAWHPKEKYIYINTRFPVNTADPVHLSEQGQYTDFAPFWFYTGNWMNNRNIWKLTDITTYTDLSGNPIESRDLINVYSAATYSHKSTLQESITINARNNEVGTDGFEDYNPFYSINSSQPWQHSVLPFSAEHFRLAQDKTYLISLEKPHTGYYSLKIPKDSVIIKTCILKNPVPDTQSVVSTAPPFLVQPVHCSDVFAPTPGKKYFVSFWYYNNDTSASGLQFKILFDHSPLIFNIESISPLIEGWRQYNCSFDLIGRDCGLLEFVFRNNSANIVYLDDFRVHPYNANMKTFIYNPFTHQLIAVLDENNYALIYQYDAMQQMQNTIKETEKGRIFLNYRIKELFRK